MKKDYGMGAFARFSIKEIGFGCFHQVCRKKRKYFQKKINFVEPS